jgi:hypothetical protein
LIQSHVQRIIRLENTLTSKELQKVQPRLDTRPQPTSSLGVDQRANAETVDEEKGHRGGAQVQAGRGPPPSAPAQRLPESEAQPASAAQPASRRKVADDGPHPPN